VTTSISTHVAQLRRALPRLGPHVRMYVMTAIALALALSVRLYVLAQSHGMMDGDEAVLGIQAERILHGAHPIYFYGQPYMGSWEAYLEAPLIALNGPSAAALHAVTLIESLLLVPLMGALAARLYGGRARLPAMLLSALPPLYVTVNELRAIGGYVETLVLGTTLLLLLVAIAGRWQAGRPTFALWIAAGFVTGFTLWLDLLIACYLVAGALWMLPHAGRQLAAGRHAPALTRGVVRGASGFVAGALVGALPAIAYAVRHDGANITFFLSYSSPAARVNPWLPGVVAYFLHLALPNLAGTLFLWQDAPLHLHAIQDTVLAITELAVAYTVWRLLPPRRLDGKPPEDVAGPREPDRWRYALAPLLLVVVFVLFWRSAVAAAGALSPIRDASGRYALPLTTGLTLVLAAFLGNLPLLLGRFSLLARQTPPSVLRLGGAALAVCLTGALLVAYALPYRQSNLVRAMQSPYRQELRFPADYQQLMTYLAQHHIRYIWVNHWIGQVIMYLDDGRTVTADYVELYLRHGPNRVPWTIRELTAARDPSFIVEDYRPGGVPALLRVLGTLHIPYTSAHFGPLWVITPLGRTVTPQQVLASLQTKD
jgi:hypothetical protein